MYKCFLLDLELPTEIMLFYQGGLRLDVLIVLFYSVLTLEPVNQHHAKRYHDSDAISFKTVVDLMFQIRWYDSSQLEYEIWSRKWIHEIIKWDKYLWICTDIDDWFVHELSDRYLINLIILKLNIFYSLSLAYCYSSFFHSLSMYFSNNFCVFYLLKKSQIATQNENKKLFVYIYIPIII